jgi:glycosyltransferase involved in cell wall biosynthesis
MRLLFVVNDVDFFISHRLPIAEFALKNNYKVFVASNSIPNPKIKGITFFKFDIKRSSIGLWSNLNSLIQLKKIARSVSPDIVHSITLKSIVLLNLSLIFNRKIKKVNTVSGLGYLFTSERKSIVSKIVKYLFKIINNIGKLYYIFQNENDLQEFKKLGVKENYILIRGSGVDHKEFKYTLPKTNPKLNITFTGRILKDKGILELIKAVEIFPKEIRSKVVLNIYGKIDLDNPAHITEKELKKLLKPNFIVWHGNTNDIKSVLALSDIYCLPSYREGLPKSTLEAMAIGRPIVTTNAPGCEDTVLEGINGFKMDIKDYKALSEKLQLLIEDEPLRIKMGKKSREIFEENFTLDKVVKQTFELYDSLIVKN